MGLHPRLAKFLEDYRLWKQRVEAQDFANTIVVDEVIAKVALFYEKIRGIVDWREEHLLRKTAIERILKRRILFQSNKQEIAEPLLKELIRGGHFANRHIPVSKIQIVQETINKYTSLIYHIAAARRDLAQKQHKEIEDWLLRVAASEIEELLDPPQKERLLIEYTTQEMAERIQISPANFAPPENEIRLQLYIAAHRALFKLDEAILTYHLIEKIYPSWRNLTEEDIARIAKELPESKLFIEKTFAHPLAEKFYQLVERYDTAYLLIGDIVFQNPKDFEKHEILEARIQKAYAARLDKLKTRMGRTALYSTISIFLTKIMVAFGVEVPFEYYVLGEFNYIALGISIFVPSLLMIFLVATTKLTSEYNIQQVVLEVMRIGFSKENPAKYMLSLASLKPSKIRTTIHALYWLMFLVTFGALVEFLLLLRFNPISITIFIMFISLVAFAGAKIRQRGRELYIQEEKSGILWSLFEIFFLPVTQVGKWLSSRVSKYNILIVVFNFLIEAPFQIFIELLEQWRMFLKEKEEEIH